MENKIPIPKPYWQKQDESYVLFHCIQTWNREEKNNIDFNMWHDDAKYLSQVNHIIMNLCEKNKKFVRGMQLTRFQEKIQLTSKRAFFYSLDNVYKYSEIIWEK